MPADGDNSVIGNNAVLTLVALSDNKIFYYHGDFGQALKEGSFGITGYSMTGGIGDIIRAKQAAMDRSYRGGRKEMMLLLKPSPGSSYKNVVNLLDETLINQVKRYALVDLSAQEEQELTKRAAAKS
jgi:hypothetical protein